ncbi:MAG: O-acetyl-ADP-ribose deacetylase [Tannerellaceae bacterium]|jgi:O-acetyl-ADP-ribose deacetylase (regulator of RNase III)|nr:O-acetyl-ADP-ribose deacetylase [Tannerellaceae bacterium]
MKRIEIIRGDITKVQADAIVNAANSFLMGGGGVDGAIHFAGGPEIIKECMRIVAMQGECPTGQAVVTGAGLLPAKFVIHTVGPVWEGGMQGEPLLLAACYSNSLGLAAKLHCQSVAFPNISTGIYGYPKKQAAAIAFEAVETFLGGNSSIEDVIFVCFDEENYRLLLAEQRLRAGQ